MWSKKMKKITSLTNKFIKDLYELKKNNVKKEKGLFLIDGEDFVELAYQKNLLVYLLVLEENKKYNVEQIIVNEEIMNKLSSNKTSQNLIGVCKYKENDVIGNNEKLLYLDGVQDPGNVGTLIRTALAFNYNGVILSDDCASIYNDKVISATKGAIFKINIYQDVSLFELKEKGYFIVSTSLKDAVDYREFKNKDNFVLVLGSEGNGVKNINLEISDLIVKISMNNIDSLNVGVAGGILMNEYR